MEKIAFEFEHSSRTDNYIHHTVAFKLKHDKGSKNEKEFLKRSIEMLSSLEGVENFEVRKQISEKNDFDYELTMDFASIGAYEEYNNHPIHQSYVHDIWLKQVENFLEKDTFVLWRMPKEPISKENIRHSVAFKLKWGNGTNEEKLFLEKSVEVLTKIPKVKNFTVNKQTNENNPYDFELAMDFDTSEDYSFYNNHPDHQEYVKDIWLEQVDSFLEKDTVFYGE